MFSTELVENLLTNLSIIEKVPFIPNGPAICPIHDQIKNVNNFKIL